MTHLQVANGRYSLQIWKIAGSILSKLLHTAYKEIFIHVLVNKSRNM
jgi:hypothetical protein